MRSRSLGRRGFLISIAGTILGHFKTLRGGRVFSDSTAGSKEFHFHHEGILGTSLDLIVRTEEPEAAVQAEQAALQEIERLRRILSTYDSASEVSRLNAAGGPMTCSPELLEALRAYESWTARSLGVCSAQLGGLTGLWRAAEQTGVPPDAAILAQMVRSLSAPGWKASAGERTVTPPTTCPLNVDSLGKGYIIGKAAAAVRAATPSICGLLLNLGGDIFGGGYATPSRPWIVGIANPLDHADNAAPLTRVLLADRAISVSGSYERFYTVAGRRYSHLLDPRTGFPAGGAVSAAVVADDNVTANALSTALCVLNPEQGLALVKETPGAECLIVTASGEQIRSAYFAALEVPATGDSKKANETKPSLWPNNFKVTLTLTLKGPAGGGGGYRRPYVAIWVENAKRVRVRTIAVWGNQQRYFPNLYDWSYGEKDRLDWAATIARATRPPGRHRVVWDGRDDSGNPVPPGTYTVFVEANRERGTYAKQSGKIACGVEPAEGVVGSTTEFEEGRLAYGPPSPE